MNEIETLRRRLAQETQARKQAEALAEQKIRELHESERRLLDAIECISEGFALYDADDRLLIHNSKFPGNFNPAVKAMLMPGVTFESIIRETVRRGLVAHIDGGVDAWLQRRLQRHRDPEGPFIEQRRNGRWIQINERKTRDGGTVAVYSDLTDFKQRERELRAVLDTIDYGVLFLDPELHIRVHNRAYREIWQMPEEFFVACPSIREDMEYTRLTGLYDVPEEGWEDYMENRLKAFKKGAIPPTELRLANGKVIEFQCIELPDGGRMLTYLDLTEHKHTEDALRKAKEAAEEAARAKSRFLANMSHELRTPLNAIIGIAEMLQEEAEELDQADWVEPLARVYGAGNRLLMLINEILDFAKIDAGHLQLNLERFDVPALIHEVMTAARAPAENNGNRLECRCPTDLGVMHNDPARVRQLLLNLLSNACKFTERGEIRLEATRERRAGQDWVIFSVSDTGIGIDHEQRARLFGAFTQIDASSTRKYGGAGLGLALSKRLCRLMGGEITVDSTLNTGTTFTVQLPATVAGEAKAPVSVVRAIRDGGR